MSPSQSAAATTSAPPDDRLLYLRGLDAEAPAPALAEVYGVWPAHPTWPPAMLDTHTTAPPSRR